MGTPLYRYGVGECQQLERRPLHVEQYAIELFNVVTTNVNSRAIRGIVFLVERYITPNAIAVERRGISTVEMENSKNALMSKRYGWGDFPARKYVLGKASLHSSAPGD